MKRKEFIKTSSAFAIGTAFVPFGSCKPQKKDVQPVVAETLRKNWAGNYQYKAKHLYEPTTVAEVQSLVKKLDKQKALGSCHCFNNIADSPVNQISTKKLNRLISIDENAHTVTVEAGAKYGDFAPELHQKGYALHNLASLPHISVAGACATATHGSGVTNGNLATAVSAIQLVTPNGDLIDLSRDGDRETFNGAVVNLGALGIVTEVTLDIQKTYEVRQDVFQDLPLASLKENFDTIMASGYSTSLFTDWQDQNISQVWIKRRMDRSLTDLGTDFHGAKAATRNLHPITKLSAENCTEQMGVPGPWYDRLPHFKMGFTPSSGEELQSEFFIPSEQALEAILAVEEMRDDLFPQLFITEIRSIKADDFWMSPCYQQDCITIHFTWKQHTKEVNELLPRLEAKLASFNARPHWGKIFKISPSVLHSRYTKYADFLKLVERYDPNGKFRNDYLNLNIYPI